MKIMAEIQPLRSEIDREEDGRILAPVPDLPGVMAYGNTEDTARRKVKSVALQVLPNMIECGVDVHEPPEVLSEVVTRMPPNLPDGREPKAARSKWIGNND